MNNSTSNGNCIHMNEVTGTPASKMLGITIGDFPSSIMPQEKTIIMVAIDKNRVKRPIIILVGKDLEKSSLE
ncbi:hypothetical protein D8674_006482 [Pyrus ussuriensis x Pyrus communis]|uniref:Uncharacterized protein n=1 Tax=Pyrus ussuriensis x Pyrus communis TaxID=2448454 RepID=A0A5N5FUE8_9ROSA|nr:hypothetical protein D8674_006482 [Pyrus ussuriensis x Pyrus communis]